MKPGPDPDKPSCAKCRWLHSTADAKLECLHGRPLIALRCPDFRDCSEHRQVLAGGITGMAPPR